MIVTIDGPAGSGKSTAARRLAERLGVAYLDTGAMYRAVALKALREGVSLRDRQALARLARACDIRFQQGPEGQRVLLDGADVTEAIRSMEVNEATPSVAAVPQVREALVDKQRRLAELLGSLIAEGRDQGSVVFPHADVKFVLEADVAARARRRHAEMVSAGHKVSYEQVLANVVQRDQADQKHWLGLLESGEAIKIDTTRMSQEVEKRCHQSGQTPD